MRERSSGGGGTERGRGEAPSDGGARDVLIVEDDPILADALRRAVTARGHRARAVVSTEADALALLDTAADAIDAALLDADLHGAPSVAVADRLRAAGVPFLVVSGHSAPRLRELGFDAPSLRKPFRAAELAKALARLPARGDRAKS